VVGLFCCKRIIVKLILFDIDGTLLLTRGSGREATRAAMIEVFGTCGAMDRHVFGGKTDWQTLVELLSESGLTSEGVEAQMAVYEAAAARHLERVIGNYPTTACPGALEVVHALRQRDDVLLGIVTGNTSATAPIKLRAGGFDPDWFVVGAYGSEAMHRDNLPALALERAIRHVGYDIAPEDVIVIGDTPADVSCARALGARAVAVLTGFSRREELLASAPDDLLDDLTGFLQILA
jgi:phosphoglycolate phosphatase-like HAD superfamily hydrolase